MQINKLDHINIRTTQLDAMIAWYETVLGLRRGARPDFGFDGAWMYAGDSAVAHLIGIDGPPAVGSEASLKLEHFAFTASGSADFETRLKAHEIAYRRAEVADISVVAFNIWDPDGNHIHVDFRSDE